MPEPQREDKESIAEKRRANPAVGFGSSFAAGMAIFALSGHWLDKKTGRESLFTLLGIGLGLLYGAWELWKLITDANRAQTQEEDQQKNDANESNK